MDEPRPDDGPAESDPDYRFTLANERTFLAWLRTSLAMLAGAVALVHVVADGEPTASERLVSVLLAVIGVGVCLSSVRRWRRVQQAMRRGLDLPASRDPIYLGTAVAAVGVAVIVLVTK